MRHYEFCVDLMDGDDDDVTGGKFGAVSCAACTKVNFSTSISLFLNLGQPTKPTSILCRIIPVLTSAVHTARLSLRILPIQRWRSVELKR